MSKSRHVSLPVLSRDTGERLRETQTRLGRRPAPSVKRGIYGGRPARQHSFSKSFPRAGRARRRDPQRALNPFALEPRADGCACSAAGRTAGDAPSAERRDPGFAEQVKTGVIWRSGSQLIGQLIAWTSTFLVLRMLKPGRLRAGGDDRGDAHLPQPVQRLGIRQRAGPRRDDRQASGSARPSAC